MSSGERSRHHPAGHDDAVDRAIAAHRAQWGPPAFVARAPGRVNLIGEHTDYNGGFVLPMAIPADTAIAVTPTPDLHTIAVWSEGFGSIEIDGVDRAPIDPGHWAAHVGGVVQLAAEAGLTVSGWRATIATDVPIGASLSSSAALEVAATMGLLQLNDTSWTPLEVAQLCQRVENDVLGLPSGIMDQLVSAAATVGHACLIDCRSLEVRPVAMPAGTAIAIMDTGTRRKLTESAFAERRATCVRACELLGIDSLRDAELDDLDRLDRPETSLEHRRARHVVTENQRTLDAAAAMAARDQITLGRLMNDSHRSLHDDYEVTGPALNRIVDAARSAPGCLGARMTGGGFAGCAVALVDAAATADFEAATLADYAAGQPPTADVGESTVQPRIWFCEPSAGATIVVPDG